MHRTVSALCYQYINKSFNYNTNSLRPNDSSALSNETQKSMAKSLFEVKENIMRPSNMISEDNEEMKCPKIV